MAGATTGPVSVRATGPRTPPRSAGVDLARTVAIVGMLAVHLVPGQAAGRATWSATVFGGRAAALFAVLAGVSVSLVDRRGRPGGRGSLRLLARAGLVGLLGLILTLLDSGLAIILPTYAVLFVLAVPLRHVPTRGLVALGCAVALTAPAASLALRRHLPPGPGDQPSLLTLVHPAATLRAVLVTGYYPVLTWSTYLLAGLAIGRLQLSRARAAVGLLLGGAVLATVATAGSVLLLRAGGTDALRASLSATGQRPGGLALRLTQSGYGTTPTDTRWWLAVAQQHTGTTPDLLATTGAAAATLGACLLLAAAMDRGPGRVPLFLLASPGTMPLTVYTLQVVVLGLGWEPDSPVRGWLWWTLLAVLGTGLWRARWDRGPLESLLPRLGRGRPAT